MDTNSGCLTMIMTPIPTPQGIIVYKNMLSLDLIRRIEEFAKLQTSCRSNHSCWNEGIVKSSNAVLVYDLSEELMQEIFTAVRTLAPDLAKFGYLYAMYYKWMPGSYIPWHADHAWDFAMTIYCNPEWNIDWGGYFAYKVASDIKCIKPEFNNAVRIHTPLEHSVFSTTPDAQPRTTIQVFGRYAK